MGLCGTATGSSLSVDEPDELCARYIVLHAVVKVRWTSAVGVQVREVHFKFISSSLDCFTEKRTHERARITSRIVRVRLGILASIHGRRLFRSNGCSCTHIKLAQWLRRRTQKGTGRAAFFREFFIALFNNRK